VLAQVVKLSRAKEIDAVSGGNEVAADIKMTLIIWAGKRTSSRG